MSLCDEYDDYNDLNFENLLLIYFRIIRKFKNVVTRKGLVVIFLIQQIP